MTVRNAGLAVPGSICQLPGRNVWLRAVALPSGQPWEHPLALIRAARHAAALLRWPVPGGPGCDQVFPLGTGAVEPQVHQGTAGTGR